MKPCRVLLADPPWQYCNRHNKRKDGGKTRFGIGVAARYGMGVMKSADIASLDVGKICTDDAYLFLWATWPTLPDALAVIAGWGFMYSTCFKVWEKLNPCGTSFAGAGRWSFSNTEFVLLGHRGPCWHPNTGWKPMQVTNEPHPRTPKGRIIHSRKPESVQIDIDQWLRPYAGAVSFVELFATRRRPGWDCAGHELDGRDVRHVLSEMYMKIEVAKL